MPRKKQTPTGPREKYARDLGPLHRLLIRCCPPSRWHKQPDGTRVVTADPLGVKSIAFLAAWLSLDSYSLYKWITKGEVPPRRASAIVDLAEGRATLADFGPFIYM